MAEAEAWIRRAIDVDTRYAVPWNLARDHALYADWFKKKGDIQGAKEQLTKAIDLFRECGADGWVTTDGKSPGRAFMRKSNLISRVKLQYDGHKRINRCTRSAHEPNEL